MDRPISRRTVVAALAALPVLGCSSGDGDDTGDSGPSTPSDAPVTPSTTVLSTAVPPTAAPSSPSSLAPVPATDVAFAELEARFDARLGVFAVDTRDEAAVAHRADERFAYCSTFKALLAGAILRAHTLEQLDEVVHYGAADLVANSPVTEQHVGSGMSLRELCDATVRFSDNAAANLLLVRVGGPQGLNAALRELGDDVTRMDRIEPQMSQALPDDPRDTTSPRAFAADLRAYALGEVLEPDRRALLVDWMERNTTGDALIRAGVPAGWRVADKTGSGGYGTRNDVGVVWPPGQAPLVLAIMSTRGRDGATRDDALLAAAATVAIEALSGRSAS